MEENPKFPVEIQNKITDDFLTTFKEEIEKVFLDNKPDNPTYWNYYQWYDNSCGFYDALKQACYIHNFMELYDYLEDSEYYVSDILGGNLTVLMHQRGIVKEGIFDKYEMGYCNLYLKIKYKILLYKGYIKHILKIN